MPSKNPPRLALGQRVSFSATTVKERTADGGITWVEAPVPFKYVWSKEETRKIEHTEGFIVGLRFLTDYVIEAIHEGDGIFGYSNYAYSQPIPVPGPARVAWLVAYELRRKPVLVLDEHCTPLREKTA